MVSEAAEPQPEPQPVDSMDASKDGCKCLGADVDGGSNLKSTALYGNPLGTEVYCLPSPLQFHAMAAVQTCSGWGLLCFRGQHHPLFDVFMHPHAVMKAVCSTRSQPWQLLQAPTESPLELVEVETTLTTLLLT